MNNFDINEQLTDLLYTDEKGSRLLPKNPVNIIWMLEHWDYSNNPDKTQIDEFLAKLKAKPIQAKTRKNIYYTSPVAKVFTDQMIIKRLDDLLQQGLDINEHLNTFIDFKSVIVLQHAMEKDLVLKPHSLSRALETRQKKFALYVYSLEQSDKTYINHKKNNIAHLAVRTRNYAILEKELQASPEKFYIQNSEGKTVVDYLLADKGYSKIKDIDCINSIITNVLNSHYRSERIIPDSTLDKMYQNAYLKAFISQYNHDKWHKEMSTKDEVEARVRKI